MDLWRLSKSAWGTTQIVWISESLARLSGTKSWESYSVYFVYQDDVCLPCSLSNVYSAPLSLSSLSQSVPRHSVYSLLLSLLTVAQSVSVIPVSILCLLASSCQSDWRRWGGTNLPTTMASLCTSRFCQSVSWGAPLTMFDYCPEPDWMYVYILRHLDNTCYIIMLRILWLYQR